MSRPNTDVDRALAELTDAIARADGPVRCVGRDDWISGDPESVEFAILGCTGCPVFQVCGATADRIRATAGVWAGVDRGAKAPRAPEVDLG